MSNTDSVNDARHYLVRWEMDFWADDPVDAARQARAVQLDPESVATWFDVKHVRSGVKKSLDLEQEENALAPLLRLPLIIGNSHGTI